MNVYECPNCVALYGIPGVCQGCYAITGERYMARFKTRVLTCSDLDT